VLCVAFLLFFWAFFCCFSRYHSLCPSEWIEKWDEQRENGTFPGPAFVNADWQPEQK
jgi:hypothetical protein